MSVIKSIDNFSIEQICDSGQCFRMKKTDNGKYEVIAKDKYLSVSQVNDTVTFECSDDEYESFWKSYFDIDSGVDYGEIKKSIDKDDLYLNSAARYGGGIRILNQDLWEMIISFIISQRNNIKRIRTCISRLCNSFGEKAVHDGIEYYCFPTPEALYNADIDDIKACGVGYRDAYIKRVAEAVYTGAFDIGALADADYETAKKMLLSLYGVGEKVADCICLFALHKTEAFPKDTHIISVINNKYNGDFPFSKYKDYAGILQQYIFFYDLNGGL